MGMVDVFNIHHASKISWIKRLYSRDQAKWKNIMLQSMKTNLYMLNTKYNYKIDKNISEFYHQVLTAWKELAIDYNEIINEYIIYNERIKFDNKLIHEKFINNDIMLNLKIKDVMDDNLNFKPPKDLNKDMNTMITQMKYNSLRSAISADWIKKQMYVGQD